MVLLGLTVNPNTPVHIYTNAEQLHADLGRWRNSSIVYQWYNLVTGITYVGSGSDGCTRLTQYYSQSILNNNRRLERSISKYGHNSFAVAIIEVVGNKKLLLVLGREQYWLDILFTTVPANLRLNLTPSAGTITGYKHTNEYRASRSGMYNPIHPGRRFSPEYLARMIVLASIIHSMVW